MIATAAFAQRRNCHHGHCKWPLPKLPQKLSSAGCHELLLFCLLSAKRVKIKQKQRLSKTLRFRVLNTLVLATPLLNSQIGRVTRRSRKKTHANARIPKRKK